MEEIGLSLLGGSDDGGLEQSIIDLVSLDCREVDLGGGGNHGALGNTGEGNSIDLAGSCKSTCKKLQKTQKEKIIVCYLWLF